MSRSVLSTKFDVKSAHMMETEFKAEYRKENEKQFKGNVLHYVTLGVIQRKGLPDIDDILFLIKHNNNNCTIEQAMDIYIRWQEIEGNTERGVVGAFCDVCKDTIINFTIDKTFTDAINNLEDVINKQQEAKAQAQAQMQAQMQIQLTGILDKLKDMSKNLGIENKSDTTKNIVDIDDKDNTLK